MAREKPVFPMQLDCGFDPEMEYFQILEDARRSILQEKTSPDSLRFSLKKPISDEDPKRLSKKRRKWWRNPLLLLKWRRTDGGKTAASGGPPRPKSLSGPLYLTESNGAAPLTPCRRKSFTGPLRFSEMGDLEIPYICLRDSLAAIVPPSPAHSSSNSLPIYLVT